MMSKAISLIFSILILLGTFLGLVSPALALGLGMFSGIFKLANSDLVVKSKPLQKYLLQASVVGLGFGIQIKEAMVVGSNSFFVTLITIVLVFIVAFVLGKILNSDRVTTILVASGTAICGGSAIAAVSPSIKANSNQTSISLAIVFLLNAVALFIFPSIGQYFQLSQEQFGLWSAIAIHDTSSVVGAAELFGEESLGIATTTKLVRTLWIIPLVLIISFGSETKGKFKFPWFILGFLAAISLTSYLPNLETIFEQVVWASRKLLIFTLFLIGLQISIDQLKKLGYTIVIVGVATWLILAALSLFYIINFE